LLPPFLAFTATIAMRGVLTRRDSELLALRASINCRCAPLTSCKRSSEVAEILERAGGYEAAPLAMDRRRDSLSAS
jgi:hypothetical protein